MQIPFIGDIEDDSITNQEKIPAGHAATRFQRWYHFLLLNPMQLFSGVLQSQEHRETDGEGVPYLSVASHQQRKSCPFNDQPVQQRHTLPVRDHAGEGHQPQEGPPCQGTGEKTRGPYTAGVGSVFQGGGKAQAVRLLSQPLRFGAAHQRDGCTQGQ